MADIISFQKTRVKEDDLEAGDINQLLKRAALVLKEKGDFTHGKLNVKSIFEKKITEEIFRANLVSSDVFLCSIYVSNLLDGFTRKYHIPSWWAIDYAVSDNPLILQQGGDTCFIICSVFPERGNVRLMNLSYYQKIGADLYRRYYNLTNREIGYHMSCHFKTMAQIVQNCMKNFRGIA